VTLTIDEVSVRYGQRVAVQPTSLEFPPGSMVALVGPNGAGKSSLLKAVAGLIDTMGGVRWEGRALAPLDSRARGRTLAYLPQTPNAHWPMKVRDLIALGRLPHQAFGEKADDVDREAIQWAMDRADVASLAERSIGELSGGEHARAQLARALAVRAPVLLVDEPVTSLDPYHQLHIMAVLQDYAGAHALVIAVLHDIALAARFCTRMILMHEGNVVEDGSPEQVLREEALRRYYRVQPYVARHEDQPVIVPWSRLDS